MANQKIFDTKTAGLAREKIIKYWDPRLQRRVERLVKVPDPAKLRGMEITEITDAVNKSIKDLSAPLHAADRTVLCGELKKALPDTEAVQAINLLSSTWLVEDDRALKLMGRLVEQVEKNEKGREMAVYAHDNIVILNNQLTHKHKSLKREQKALAADLTKVVNERDVLRRANGGTARAEATAKSSREELRKAQTATREAERRHEACERALTQTINEKAALQKEHTVFVNSAERNLELAISEYESQVVGKLASVADDHNKMAVENRELTAEINEIKTSTKKKERAMNESVNQVNETEADEDILRAGAEVYTKVANEGPFVLVARVDEGAVEYSNPIPNSKNSFHVGKLPISDCWVVRCKNGSFRTFPPPLLTTIRPKSSFSLSGVKGAITSDVTGKLFQAAIWVTMLTLLFMRG